MPVLQFAVLYCSQAWGASSRGDQAVLFDDKNQKIDTASCKLQVEVGAEIDFDSYYCVVEELVGDTPGGAASASAFASAAVTGQGPAADSASAKPLSHASLLNKAPRKTAPIGLSRARGTFRPPKPITPATPLPPPGSPPPRDHPPSRPASFRPPKPITYPAPPVKVAQFEKDTASPEKLAHRPPPSSATSHPRSTLVPSVLGSPHALPGAQLQIAAQTLHRSPADLLQMFSNAPRPPANVEPSVSLISRSPVRSDPSPPKRSRFNRFMEDGVQVDDPLSDLSDFRDGPDSVSAATHHRLEPLPSKRQKTDDVDFPLPRAIERAPMTVARPGPSIPSRTRRLPSPPERLTNISFLNLQTGASPYRDRFTSALMEHIQVQLSTLASTFRTSAMRRENSADVFGNAEAYFRARGVPLYVDCSIKCGCVRAVGVFSQWTRFQAHDERAMKFSTTLKARKQNLILTIAKKEHHSVYSKGKAWGGAFDTTSGSYQHRAHSRTP
ncbi:hypothetical protein BDK51DRAFT_48116 [Blyttiomyces helicus]|uniref:Uncharacterized protein n=1 Tax=Blyttiomyces helicus TaxID=388810 RepID=A0A4P9VYR3_9FUNG|nr:hypothetical protein BDK51DRAFT_48116 [Blyttiomyces helicus]|eukprot:RKO83903.1 hypothetical protein BDK51DRAFT_48116 [Blyttiomyces helicus]